MNKNHHLIDIPTFHKHILSHLSYRAAKPRYTYIQYNPYVQDKNTWIHSTKKWPERQTKGAKVLPVLRLPTTT